MAWQVACLCGHTFACIPPAVCPNCLDPVPDGTDSDRAWLDRVRDEFGPTGTTTTDPTGQW